MIVYVFLEHFYFSNSFLAFFYTFISSTSFSSLRLNSVFFKILIFRGDIFLKNVYKKIPSFQASIFPLSTIIFDILDWFLRLEENKCFTLEAFILAEKLTWIEITLLSIFYIISSIALHFLFPDYLLKLGHATILNTTI